MKLDYRGNHRCGGYRREDFVECEKCKEKKQPSPECPDCGGYGEYPKPCSPS